MAQGRQFVLILTLTLALLEAAAGPSPKFFPDDPIKVMPPPMPVTNPVKSSISHEVDFVSQSWNQKPYWAPAGAINTLGEVPDSEWFTNRHLQHRLTRVELQRGPGSAEAPVPPFTVTSGKTEGISAGFTMQDAKGRRFFIKGDPPDYPELSTSADVIVSKFLYAIGYNVPTNEILDLKMSDLMVADTATIKVKGRSRTMNWADIEDIVRQLNHQHGSLRVVASLAVDGEPIGPFRYEGTRPDDPNDIVPHENRRDMRGLYVISAWVNNTDMKANNTLDTVVEENGVRFIRHYIIDFGSALGSDGSCPKDVRFGNEYVMSKPTEALKQVLTLGLFPEPWETFHYPHLRGVGTFESQLFQPDDWKPDYPNLAFLNRRPDDDYWATKQVMAFTNDDIRAIVETARLSSPRSADYIVATLAERRDKLGRMFFSKILPLDHFRVENSELLFDDLAVQYGFQSKRPYQVRWFRFDNTSRILAPIPGGVLAALPPEVTQASSGSYFSAIIDSPGSRLKPVTVYLRRNKTAYNIVGIDRAW